MLPLDHVTKHIQNQKCGDCIFLNLISTSDRIGEKKVPRNCVNPSTPMARHVGLQGTCLPK